MSKYEDDLKECQEYAKQESPVAAATVGAVVGAVFLTALAAIGGGNRDASAGVGALLGGAGGANESAQQQKNIIRNCLSGRGYSVLR